MEMNKTGFGFLRLPKKKGSYDWELINEMTDYYLEHGGFYFDTCYTYLNGQSEEGIRRCVVSRKPRNSFMLADKIPGYQCRSYEDCQKFFDEECRRCGVEYFDVLMLHWLNGKNYAIAEKYDEFRFLREKKAEGKALRIGFSYHDSADLLEEILTAHPEVDVVQLQINYLDWDTAGIESRKCYETCVRHGKKVIVMEPVKGGTLAQLPAEADNTLRKRHSDWSPAQWALRFVQSLPEVEICLSGMNTMDQMRENMEKCAPLSEEERNLLLSIRSVINGNTKVPCTACRYCESHCPKRIAIPDYFKMYNEISRYPEDGWKIQPSYEYLRQTRGSASECIACHSCEQHCPQNIQISSLMKEVAAVFQ